MLCRHGSKKSTHKKINIYYFLQSYGKIMSYRVNDMEKYFFLRKREHDED